MEHRRLIGTIEYFLMKGDLTRLSVDAIVNAANSTLMGGGGVDGAIHRRGGPAILAECLKIRERYGLLDPGEAVITTGGELPARHVIHTVGPIWRGGRAGEEECLRRCYLASLELAEEHAIRTLAFPSISTGAFRFPVDRAARVAQSAVLEAIAGRPPFDRIGFVLFDAETFRIYRHELDRIPSRDPK